MKGSQMREILCRGLHLDGRAGALAAVAEARDAGAEVAAFFCESIPSCGGQIILPEGYLAQIYDVMRAEGVICVADEVILCQDFIKSGFSFFSKHMICQRKMSMRMPVLQNCLYKLLSLVTR